MAITRAELKRKVLGLLYKSPQFMGVYDELTLDDAIQEAMDTVAIEMFKADEGWLKKIIYLNTEPNAMSIDLPVSAAMICEVRLLIGTVYVPLRYNQKWGEVHYSENSGAIQWAGDYEIIDNALYFNPPLAVGGEGYLQLVYQAYPKVPQSDNDFLDSQFDNTMANFIKYRAASIMATTVEKSVIPWAGLDSFWHDKMQDIVKKRVLKSQTIKEFNGW